MLRRSPGQASKIWSRKGPEKGMPHLAISLQVSYSNSQECVICGHVYVTETDWAGRENLVPLKSQTSELSTSIQSQSGNSHAMFSVSATF